MASGWDHELLAVGQEWVFRFPRREDRVVWLMREREILEVVGETLKRRVPRFELIGRASPAFPYPFVGYRRIAGVEAARYGTHEVPTLARDVGTLLSELHRVDPHRIPPTPDAWEQETWATLRGDLVDFTDAMVGDPVLDMAGLIGIDGYRFIDEVLAHYGLALGDDYGAKLRWVTRTLTLTWLADATRHAPDALAKHLRRVARAFD